LRYREGVVAAESRVFPADSGVELLGGKRRQVLIAALALCVVVAIGVVVASSLAIWPFNQHSAKALERRAQYYWDLRISGDILGAYQYMAETYRRRVEVSGFAREGGSVVWTGAKVRSVTLDDAGGLVEITLKYRFQQPNFAGMENESTVKERWVFENGTWFRWPPGSEG